ISAPCLHRGIVLIVAADGEEGPRELSGFRVDAEDRTAIRPLAALRSDDDLAVRKQRRTGETDGQLLRFDELRLPRLLAGFHVDRDELAIERAHINVAEADRDAAVVRRVSLLGDQILIELLLVRPDEIARRAVEREQLVVRA